MLVSSHPPSKLLPELGAGAMAQERAELTSRNPESGQGWVRREQTS